MRYLAFQQIFRPYYVFSIRDIQKHFPNGHLRRLVDWQKKDYIFKIRNKHYCFQQFPKEEAFLWLVSNCIYKPSYISLVSALSYYNIIPEGVYTITAVSTLKTQKFDTIIGTFSYRNFKRSLFFGYQLLPYKNRQLLIAYLEKAILDYLYLDTSIKTLDDIAELRWNAFLLAEQMNWKRFYYYSQQYRNKACQKRIQLFLLWYENQ